MKILIHKQLYLDASTPEKEAAAYKYLFLHLKNNNHYDSVASNLELEKFEKDCREMETTITFFKEHKIQGVLYEYVLKELPKMARMVIFLRHMRSLWQRIWDGDERAIRPFLRSRQCCEGEGWQIAEVEDPNAKLENIS